MTIRPIAVALLLSIAWLFASMACTRSLKEQTIKTPQAQVNLLIAGDASEYKDVIRDALIQHYRARANIRVINIDTLGTIAPEAYHAILIMDTCLAWTHFNPTVRSFLERPAVNERVVWFMTVDDTEAVYDHSGVDAITAASVTANQHGVVKRLTQKIDEILKDR
jgi:hypothetical protein